MTALTGSPPICQPPPVSPIRKRMQNFGTKAWTSQQRACVLLTANLTCTCDYANPLLKQSQGQSCPRDVVRIALPRSDPHAPPIWSLYVFSNFCHYSFGIPHSPANELPRFSPYVPQQIPSPCALHCNACPFPRLTHRMHRLSCCSILNITYRRDPLRFLQREE